MKPCYCSCFLLLVSIIFSVRVANAQDTIVVNYPKEIPHGKYLKAGAVVLPVSMLSYGLLKPSVMAIRQLDDRIWNNIQTNEASFHTSAADYLMWAPTASIYLMDAMHLKTAHSFTEHLILDAGSLVIAGGGGLVMRQFSKHIDVYNTRGTEFPSGHTTNAFRGAELFHQELKQTNPVLSYSGYLVATGVGVLRLYNKNHQLTEVIAGAGLGMLSGKISYWIFDKVKYKKKK